jgi:sucrose-phosphate synthase
MMILDQLEGEEAQRTAKRRIERERGRRDATADMSEDLSEGEKGDVISDISAHGDSTKGKMPRNSSVDVMENWANQHKEKKLYIVLIRHELNFFVFFFFFASTLYKVLWGCINFL